MILAQDGSRQPAPASGRSRFRRSSSRSAGAGALAGLGAVLLVGLLSGCTVIEPQPDVATEGPCHELNEGRVQFETGDAVRVLFAVAPDHEETEVVLTSCLNAEAGYLEEWATVGFVGSGGFGPPDATEVNSLQTPTGSYTMTEGFGRSDPGTALEYHTLTPLSRWGGRADSDYFNRYFEGPGAWPDEDLWRLMQDGLYEQAVAINFNRPPDAVAQPGLSFAIFLHAGLTESWGCVSTDLETVTRVLRNATPGDRIVMGAVDDVFREGNSL